MMANCLMQSLARRRALGEWEQDLAMREDNPWVPKDFDYNANTQSWNSRHFFPQQVIQLWG